MASKGNTKDIMTRLSLDVDRALLDVLKPYALDGQQKDLIRAALYAYMGLDFPPDLMAAGFTATTIPASKQGQGGIAPIVQNTINIDTQPLADAISGAIAEAIRQQAGPPSPNQFDPHGQRWNQ